MNLYEFMKPRNCLNVYKYWYFNLERHETCFMLTWYTIRLTKKSMQMLCKSEPDGYISNSCFTYDQNIYFILLINQKLNAR